MMTSLSHPCNSNMTIMMTSLSHPCNSNTTYSPVIWRHQCHHYPFHTTIQFCPPVTSQSHHYPFHTTAIRLIPQWHDDITIPSMQQQYDYLPSDIMMTSLSHSYNSSTTLPPTDMMTSLSYSYNSITTIPQWHHYPTDTWWHHYITIPFIQQQYNSIPPVTSWHHYPIHTTAIQLYPPVTSCRMTLAPVTSQWHHYPIHTTIRLSLSDWCTRDMTWWLVCPLTHSCQALWKVTEDDVSLRKKKENEKKPQNTHQKTHL